MQIKKFTVLWLKALVLETLINVKGEELLLSAVQSNEVQISLNKSNELSEIASSVPEESGWKWYGSGDEPQKVTPAMTVHQILETFSSVLSAESLTVRYSGVVETSVPKTPSPSQIEGLSTNSKMSIGSTSDLLNIYPTRVLEYNQLHTPPPNNTINSSFSEKFPETSFNFKEFVTSSISTFATSEYSTFILGTIEKTPKITSSIPVIETSIDTFSLSVSSKFNKSLISESASLLTIASIKVVSQSITSAIPSSKIPSMSSSVFHFPHTQLTTFPSSVDVNKMKKERYLITLRSTTCPKFVLNHFSQKLMNWFPSKWLSIIDVGINNVSCQTKFSFNVSVDTLQHITQSMIESSINNSTFVLFNRTFQVIGIEKLPLETDFTSRNNVTMITMVSKNEFNAYIAVGVSFGLVLVVCISVCCAKCWAKRPSQRFGILRSSHMPLRPEDYTLTPIPRPSSLYVDYYRGSISADLYSNTSAGSIASTSPTGEKGFIQPFDTSIVPLEDTIESGECGPRADNYIHATGSGPFTIQTITSDGLIYCNSSVDSTENLNPRQSQISEVKTVGVPNPMFRKY